MSTQERKLIDQHIALFVESMGGGGAERVFSLLSENFSSRGHQVDLLLMEAKRRFLFDIASSVNIVDLNSRNPLICIIKLFQYFRRIKPDAILATLVVDSVIAIIAKGIARAKTKVVVRVANTLSQKERSWIKKKIERLLVSALYPMADEVIAVSNGVAEDLIKNFGIERSRITVIYNPINRKKIVIESRQNVSHPWLNKDQYKVVIAVGRLHKQKDYPTLLRAFSKVCRTTIPAKLIILGEGEERERLEELVDALKINQNVDMPGFVDNPYAYICRSDAYVLSSKFEGMSNTILEAMACNCPVISTNCPSSPSELLKGGKFGHLVPVGDPDALAGAIIDVLSGNGRNVDSEWLEQYDLDGISYKYLKLLIN